MPDDIFDWQADARATEAHYRAKYDAVAFSQAADIAEIGVRAGYGAAAMLQAPCVKTYTGYDNSHDGAHYLAHARERLGAPGCKFVDRDTQREDIGRHEFVHIDGDHSFEGASHDLWMCLRLGVKWILVDDYNAGSVRDAVDAILQVCPTPYKIRDTWLMDDPLRGAVLIQV